MTVPNESRNQEELANKSEGSLVFRYQPFVSGLRHKTRDTQNKNWAAFSLTEGVSKEERFLALPATGLFALQSERDQCFPLPTTSEVTTTREGVEKFNRCRNRLHQ